MSDTDCPEIKKKTRSIGIKVLSSVIKNPTKIEASINNKCNGDYFIYKKILYQTVGDILEGLSSTNIIKNIQNNKFGFNHDCFKRIKNSIEEHDEFTINPFEVEEGVGECKKCGCKKIYMCAKQTRSQDENATTFSQCSNRQCNSKWRV